MTDPLPPEGPDAPVPSASEPPAPSESGAIARIRGAVARAFLGQEEVVDQCLVALLAEGHVLLEGVPGLGKTLLVRALARSFGGDWARIQFTPDLMPTDVTGHAIYDMKSGEFRVRRGPAFTQLLLADEINRAPAKTQAALLEVMQERQITIEGETAQLEPPFVVFATQNPVEQEGTYPLPEAQLDRFLLKVVIDYPGEDEELAIVRHVTDGSSGAGLRVETVERVTSAAEIRELQATTAQVRVEEGIARYAVQLVRATREVQGLALGSGPRGALALVRSARAWALMEGRDFVVPNDVKSIATPCLRHRVALAPELALEGRSVKEALLAVHRSYLELLWPFLEARRISGLAHITGGGLPGNVNRILGDSIDAVVDRSAWTPPGVFQLIVDGGRLEADEAYRALNMGVGMVLSLEASEAESVVADLQAAGEPAFVMGRTEPGRGEVRWA